MANDNRIVLDYDETANLDPQKLEEAKKKFQETAYGIVRDVTPVVGEAQSYKYALQDAETLKKAARGDEGFKDMTPIEALGYVGLTALGVAGMTPIVGPYARKAASGIRALMPKRGQRTPEPIRTENLPAADLPMREAVEAMERDPGFSFFVSNLPEYRQDPSNIFVNYREYMALTPDARAAYTRVANSGKLSATAKDKADAIQQIGRNQENFETKVNTNSSKALTVPKEPLTFGKGLRSNKDGTVKEYLGSAAFDEINRSGNAIGTPKEWMGYLKGLRQKGIKAEELSDSGLIIFKGDQVVGGDLFNLSKEAPKTRITKGEILASIESNPTYRLKIADYKHPINTEQILNVYPTFSKLSRDTESMIIRKSTGMENIAERSNLTAITDALNSDRMVFNDLASRLSINTNKFRTIENTRSRLSGVLDLFNDNEKLLVRNLIDQYDKAIKISKSAMTTTKAPRHGGSFPGGGTDYREKVLFLDESIPGNTVGKRVYSVHFNEPNAVTFLRYDTRGVDNYGDTYFMVELQSDPHQTLSKSASSHLKNFKAGRTEIDPKSMIRKNPYSKNIRLRVKKREIQDTLDEMSELQNINKERPLTPPEQNRLNELTTNLKVQESQLKRMPARQGEAVTPSEYDGGSLYNEDRGDFDFFPMGNESTWVKANIRSMVHDARQNNKRYIALAPADFWQLKNNDSFKIEQFYGLGNKQLSDDLLFFDGSSSKVFDNKDGSGFGKFRDRKTDKIVGTAVVPKAMQEVAKEIGATLTSKKVFHTDPKKPYKLYSEEKKIPQYAFKKKFEMEEFYENLDRKGGLEMIKMETDDPRNFVESIVIDLQGSRKKAKMKAYKFGGLVEVDRSNFAPLF